MKLIKTILVFLVATQGFLFSENISMAEQDTAPPVLINEIFWSGSSTSLADEFIELANTTPYDVDISEWVIENAANGGDKIILPTSSTIPALGFFLVANYSSDNEKTILAKEGDYVSNAISLANSDARYVLRDTEGNSIDEAGNGSGAPFAGDNELKASMARKPGCWDGGMEGCWFTTDSQENIKSEFADLATPGLGNNWTEPLINLPPKAKINAPATAEINIEIIFDGQDSSDPEESDLEFSWHLDDEEISTQEYFLINFSQPATHEILLTVFDGELENSTSTEIIIYPEPETPYIPAAGDILINEFIPDPAGDNEWIEIINNTTSTIELTGWEVWDGKSKIYEFANSLATNEMALANLSSAKLNNSGDQIILKFGEIIIDSVTYGDWEDEDIGDNAPSPGQLHALARLPGAADSGSDLINFKITSTPTPGGINSITAPPQDEEEENEEAEPPLSDPKPNPEPEPAEEETPEPASSYNPNDLLINEFVSDPPTGGVEWIEVYNPGNENINLSDWIISDAAGGKTLLSGEIKSKEYIIIYSPKGQLNNGNDEISLFDPSNNLIHKITYGYDLPSPQKGESLARKNDNNWAITLEPTPGSANIIKPSNEHADDDELLGAGEKDGKAKTELEKKTSAQASSGTKKTASKESVYLVTSFDEMPAWQEKEKIQISATVTALPGTLGKQYFYAGTSSGQGLQIYNYKKEFPELKIGDQITAQGELSKTYDMWRLKIKSRDDIGITGHNEIEAFEIALDEIDYEFFGGLVKLKAEVSEFKSSYLYADDGHDEIKVQYQKGGSLNNIILAPGDKIIVTGILTAAKAGHRLETRLPDDIEIINQYIAESEPEEEKRPYNNWAGIVPLGLLVVLGIANIKKLKKLIPKKQ